MLFCLPKADAGFMWRILNDKKNRRTVCQVSGTPPAEYLSVKQDPRPAESISAENAQAN
jgi:hypothetical protein